MPEGFLEKSQQRGQRAQLRSNNPKEQRDQGNPRGRWWPGELQSCSPPVGEEPPRGWHGVEDRGVGTALGSKVRCPLAREEEEQAEGTLLSNTQYSDGCRIG